MGIRNDLLIGLQTELEQPDIDLHRRKFRKSN